MTATSLNPLALVLDFSPALKGSPEHVSNLTPEVAWILYDKTHQQIIRRGHYPVNLESSQPKSKIHDNKYIMEDLNHLLSSYHAPELVVEDFESITTINKNLLTPNLQLDNSTSFSVIHDYQEKSDLPCSSLDEILLSRGKIDLDKPLTNLSYRADQILEYYLDSIARKEREQPYSYVREEVTIKKETPSLWAIISQYFLGLNLTGAVVLGLHMILSGYHLQHVVYILIGLIISLFIFKHLKR